jgi:phage tail sheath protein FI
MPEYLAPGVYVEEVSFRSKSIEGVPTSTTGFAGMCRFGPVQYPEGPRTTEPRLITSFTEFERVYGGLESLEVGPSGGTEARTSYLAHAARVFFLNGGKRLYVSRTFTPRDVAADLGVASRAIPVGTGTATWRARWPGALGNVWIETRVTRTKNLAYVDTASGLVQVRSARRGAIVEIIPAGDPIPVENAPLDLTRLARLGLDTATSKQTFERGGVAFQPAATDTIQLVELTVEVRVDPERTDAYTGLAADPDRDQKRYIGHILQKDDPEDENAVVWLDWNPATAGPDAAAQLMVALQGNTQKRLEHGNDGLLCPPTDLLGKEADPDVPDVKATGLEALAEIDDIAIVALPDGGTYDDVDQCFAAGDALVAHAERSRYRIAVVDAPQGSSMNEVRTFRGRFDSKYAALYHPWLEIFDPLSSPTQGAPPARMMLPPSGFVTGIYARNDIERGVHKAPANEVVRGLTRFEANINKPRQDVLNPEGINALRFFEGRGNRVWGARTMSSDPEWKYVNVRRLFIYLEHSIDKGTQWAVFEPNNERLWANIRQTVSDFLYTMWRDGALLGAKPDEAYFVRCDRTTMTQNDLDNGRLICLVGVAPVKPAEYVIFRIGQFTAGAKAS